MNRLGLELELDLRDHTQYMVYREGSYEPQLRRRILQELRRDDVYVDIGAHIGIHALVVAHELQRLGGGHVYAFEPTPDSSDRLATAAARNAIRNLTLVRTALGDEKGQVVMRSDPAFMMQDAAVRSAFGTGRVVGSFPMMRFDDWAKAAKLERFDIVKIDIEGSELAALIGMRDSLARLRPRLLILEVNSLTLRRAGVTEEQLSAELAYSGYAPAEKICDHGSVVNVAFTYDGKLRRPAPRRVL